MVKNVKFGQNFGGNGQKTGEIREDSVVFRCFPGFVRTHTPLPVTSLFLAFFILLFHRFHGAGIYSYSTLC